MDRRHYRNKYGWEAVTTLCLAVVAASLIGVLLTDNTPAKLGGTAFVIASVFLGVSVQIRARLQEREDRKQ